MKAKSSAELHDQISVIAATDEQVASARKLMTGITIMSDNEIFLEVVNRLNRKYGGIEIKDGVVYRWDKEYWDTAGWNMLHNLNCLCRMLDIEL